MYITQIVTNNFHFTRVIFLRHSLKLTLYSRISFSSANNAIYPTQQFETDNERIIRAIQTPGKLIFAFRSFNCSNCDTLLIRGTVFFVRTRENDAHQGERRNSVRYRDTYKVGNVVTRSVISVSETQLSPREELNKGEFSQRIWQWTWEPLCNVNRLQEQATTKTCLFVTWSRNYLFSFLIRNRYRSPYISNPNNELLLCNYFLNIQ